MQGPEKMCLSLEHQHLSKTFEKMAYFDRVQELQQEGVLPSPCTASFQALSVNALRWRIQDERLGDA